MKQLCDQCKREYDGEEVYDADYGEVRDSDERLCPDCISDKEEL